MEDFEQIVAKVRARRVAEFDETLVRDISEAVYRERLGKDDTEKMIAKDGDNGEALRERSTSYDGLTRAYLRAIKAREAIQ